MEWLWRDFSWQVVRPFVREIQRGLQRVSVDFATLRRRARISFTLYKRTEALWVTARNSPCHPIGKAGKTRQNRRGRALTPRKRLQHLGQNFGVPQNSNKCFRGLLFTFSILGFHFYSHSFTFSKNFYEIC